MDWQKWLLSGAKQILILLVSALIYVLIGALTTALGFHPEPGLQAMFWENGVKGTLVVMVAMLNNLLKHFGK